VVTDVGDSSVIVGKTGEVVPPNDVSSLVSGIENLMQQDLQAMGNAARRRIEENFSIERMVIMTENEIMRCAE